jgi:hypothetical protein
MALTKTFETPASAGGGVYCTVTTTTIIWEDNFFLIAYVQHDTMLIGWREHCPYYYIIHSNIILS